MIGRKYGIAIERPIEPNALAINITYESTRCAGKLIISGMKFMRPAKAPIAPSPIASGIKGNTNMFARSERIGIFPIEERMIGATKSCAPIVVAVASLIPNFGVIKDILGINLGAINITANVATADKRNERLVADNGLIRAKTTITIESALRASYCFLNTKPKSIMDAMSPARMAVSSAPVINTKHKSINPAMYGANLGEKYLNKNKIEPTTIITL